MSSLEKNLYKRVEVYTNKKPRPPVNSRAYRGISTVNPDNNGFALYDLSLIKQDLINHFYIRQGEKLMNPTFGTIIWDVLFDPLTDDLKEAIVENATEIINYDPRVQVNRIIVDSYEHGIQIEAEITYLNYNISETMILQFDENNNILEN